MAAYHISVHSSADDTAEFRVLLTNEDSSEMGVLDALNPTHARLIARDLMTLMRQRDPGGAFILDTHIADQARACRV